MSEDLFMQWMKRNAKDENESSNNAFEILFALKKAISHNHLKNRMSQKDPLSKKDMAHKTVWLRNRSKPEKGYFDTIHFE